MNLENMFLREMDAYSLFSTLHICNLIGLQLNS